jgi:hypothetical protein
MTIVLQSFIWLSGPSLYAFVVRGAIGIGLVVLGFIHLGTSPWLSVGLFALSLVPFGGCPMCWASGMIGAACPYEPRKTGAPD